MSTVQEPTPTPPSEPAVVQPDPAVGVVAERPCTTCGAALAERQDWCLECGSAQPGRLGDRPGWRAALTVMGATVLLATGAGAAAYAALESEATREATAQAPPPATPTQQTPPPATVETAPPTTATTPPVDPVDPPRSDPPDVPPPTADVDPPSSSSPSPTPTPAPVPTPSPTPAPTPSTGSGSGGGGTGSGSGSTGTGTDTTPAEPEPVAIALKSDFATTYDPYERGGKAVSDPANAVDGKDSTAWEAPVGPEGAVRIGLLVSLEKARKLGNLVLKADTPGFTVETYATKSSQVPPDVLDARWKHLDDARDVGIEETLKLDGTFRHVLLWITSQPADTKVAIPEITLFEPKD